MIIFDVFLSTRISLYIYLFLISFVSPLNWVSIMDFFLFLYFLIGSIDFKTLSILLLLHRFSTLSGLTVFFFFCGFLFRIYLFSSFLYSTNFSHTDFSWHLCFFWLEPPNLGLSRQNKHLPQSGVKQFTHSRQFFAGYFSFTLLYFIMSSDSTCDTGVHSKPFFSYEVVFRNRPVLLGNNVVCSFLTLSSIITFSSTCASLNCNFFSADSLGSSLIFSWIISLHMVLFVLGSENNFSRDFTSFFMSNVLKFSLFL